ncbi:RHS repeat-associated core domain-containing protein [Paraflavitalea speifideaquila]|uniref:RHS repeat-associated core domain-containing protein n=1 Tax=Paraflavitalea speifideaquila TaxID=3076558 RepID=UPI0028E47CED|nr:RHS repeat-associated core domain-containing protein [Paraflavitalea speifideiaquila]
MVNFTMAAGVDSISVEFLRSNGGTTADGPDVPYSIDNFSISRLDIVTSQTVTLCDSANATGQGLYRYGFNGKENDNEAKGPGNSIDFGARIHDPRVGRWLSLDPLQKKYPNESNYVYTGNNPILFVDPDGKDKIVTHYMVDVKTGKVTGIAKVTEYGTLRSRAIQVPNRIDKHDWHYEYTWHDVKQVVYDYYENGKRSKPWNRRRNWIAGLKPKPIITGIGWPRLKYRKRVIPGEVLSFIPPILLPDKGKRLNWQVVRLNGWN